MRALVAGLCVLFALGCADGGPGGARRVQALETDAGADAGQPPVPCNWFVYWLTTVDRDVPCNWGKVSKDPTVALFRTNGGDCLAPASICGIEACSDLTFLRENQVLEIWGPAGLDDDAVWAATEHYDCE